MSDSPGTSRRWQLDWRLLMFSGVFLPILVSLGIWQLHRADDKQLLLDQWQQEANSLPWRELVAGGLDSARPISLRGAYGDRSWLLDNRTRDGIPGYEVLTVFYPPEGPPVLVNRGWVPAPRTRDQLPDVAAPKGVLSLQGRISDYPEPPVLADINEAANGWPRRVQSLPQEAATKAVPELPSAIVRLADEKQPGAYRADWAPDLMGPQTHYGYATQWFALAAALTILTVAASYRKAGANNDNDNG